MLIILEVSEVISQTHHKNCQGKLFYIMRSHYVISHFTTLFCAVESCPCEDIVADRTLQTVHTAFEEAELPF